MVLVLLSSCLLGLLYEVRHPKLSPIDELQHIDYAYRASQGTLVRRGDLVEEPAIRAEACRGLASAEFTPPPCDTPVLDPSKFQNEGQNTAYMDPPLYYVVTGVAARALVALTPRGDFVTWARLLGTTWVILALLAIWATLGQLGIATSRRVWPLLIITSSPIVLFTQATVTSDAILMATGAGSLWAILGWERKRYPAWIAVSIVGLGSLGKLSASVAALLGGVYLLLRTRDVSRLRSRAEYLGLAAGLVATAGCISLAWTVVVAHRALIPADDIVINGLFKVPQLRLADVVSAASATLSPVQNPPLGDAFEPRTTFGLVSLQHVLMVFPPLSFLFVSTENGVLRALSAATLGLAIALGPLVAIWTFFSQGLYYPIPPRYGLALLPGMALLLGVRTETRTGLFVVSAVGLTSYLYFLSRLV